MTGIQILFTLLVCDVSKSAKHYNKSANYFCNKIIIALKYIVNANELFSVIYDTMT